LKKLANAYSVSENVLEHEIRLAENLLRKESQLPTLLEQLISFIAPYKGALDYLHKLLLIAVTLPVTSASWDRIFSKMKLVTLLGERRAWNWIKWITFMVVYSPMWAQLASTQVP